jgi:hypothetical protein
MLSIEKISTHNEELAAIGVLSGIGHGQRSWTEML